MKRLGLLLGIFFLSLVAADAFCAVINSLQDATISAAERIKDSVVAISSVQVVQVYPDVDSMFYSLFPELFGYPSQMKRIGVGSGVIIDSDGYILTNEHVVGPASDIMVRLTDGNEYRARVVAVDYKADLAVLKVDAPQPLKAAELGDSDKVKIGQWVMAVGNPFGIAFQSAEPSLSVGIVSAVHRSLPEAMWRGRNYVDLIQTDAAINPGNSGGPLVDMDGRVIGINVAIVSPSGGSVGLGFAIPINAARRVIDSALNGKPLAYGWIGVSGQDVSPRLQKYFGLDAPKGVLVVAVVPGGPADRAGIKEGDIILSFDGRPVRDIQDLVKYVSETPIGKEVVVGILRPSGQVDVYVKVAKHGEGFVDIRGSKGYKQVNTHKTSSGTVEVKGMVLAESGGRVVVVDVKPDSLAEFAGIQKGDVILRINDRRVESIEDVRAIPKDELEGNVLIKTNRGFFVILSR